MVRVTVPETINFVRWVNFRDGYNVLSLVQKELYLWILLYHTSLTFIVLPVLGSVYDWLIVIIYIICNDDAAYRYGVVFA